ncbi:MAG: hypothetical protein FWG56_01955, partial [Desulfovibrionaceae bacterium]|nr:hypothetical protein [Desulfovibrionaceae bacterium]
RRWRVRSVLTQAVNVNEAAKVNIHAVLVKVASGQLPFLGSTKQPVLQRQCGQHCRYSGRGG